MRADNIFDLLARFGPKQAENQLSAAIAFMLSFSADFRRAFFTSLLLGRNYRGDIEVRTQVSLPAERSVIDIEMENPGKALVWIESKIGGAHVAQAQAEKYARALARRRKEFREVRLCFISQLEERDALRRFLEKGPLSPREIRYFRWAAIRKLFSSVRFHGGERRFGAMFMSYLKRRSEEAFSVSGRLVEDLVEVLVLPATPDFWPTNKRHRFMTKNMSRSGELSPEAPDALFVAVYRPKPVQRITHLARVERIERWVPATTIYRGTDLEKKARREWLKSLDKVYKVQRWVELARSVPLGKAGAVRRFRRTTVSALLTATTMEDL